MNKNKNIVCIYKTSKTNFKRDIKNNIYFIKIEKEVLTQEELEEFNKELLKIYEYQEKKKKKCSFIYDWTDAGMGYLKFMHIEAKFYKSLEDRTKEIVNSVCLISSSSFFKKMVNFCLSMYGSVIPTIIVLSMDEALEKINEFKQMNF